MAKIRWCRNCHQRKLHIRVVVDDWCQVVCDGCGKKGLKASTIGRAVHNWNKNMFEEESTLKQT